MAVIEITTIFGKTIAKPMRLVDIHDVQPMADEESINNSGESKSDITTSSEVAPKPTPSAQEVSSIKNDCVTPTDEQ